MARPETPALTVDAVIFDDDGRVALIRRGRPPHVGAWAFPGGFVDVGEPVEAAAVREVLEETGLIVELTRLVGVYSDPGRDVRGHTVSVVYLATAKETEGVAGDDAAAFGWVPIVGALGEEMAFDHRQILADAVAVAAGEVGQAPLAGRSAVIHGSQNRDRTSG